MSATTWETLDRAVWDVRTVDGVPAMALRRVASGREYTPAVLSARGDRFAWKTNDSGGMTFSQGVADTLAEAVALAGES